MPDFKFFHPIEVRYGDLDPQGHVNNACYLTYMEQARIAYLHQLGLWQGDSFLDIGIILANASVTFHTPILYGQKISVGVCVNRLGKKSFDMHYIILEGASQQPLATGMSVLVTYDYRFSRSIAIPDEWRTKLSFFEKLHQSQVIGENNENI